VRPSICQLLRVRFLMRRIAAFAAVLCLLAFPANAATKVFYVATNGNDAWSGTLPAPNGPQTDGPLATLPGARNKVRAWKTGNGGTLPGPVEVQFRGGVYRFEQTVSFDYDDAGAFGKTVTYKAYPGETPVFSGGRPVTGWTQAGALWRAALPQVAAGTWWFGVLYVDGELLPPARDPNFEDDPGDADGDRFFNALGGVDGAAESLYYAAADLQPCQNPNDVLYMVLHKWDVSFHRLQTLDETDRIITFQDIDSGTTGADHAAFVAASERQRYCVYHAYEALDAPGEWWLDRATGYLYYYPKPGESMAGTEVIAPVVERLVEFKSTKTFPLSYVTLQGLSFQHTDYAFGPNALRPAYYGLSEALALTKLPGALECTKVSDCVIEDCEFAHLAAHGVLLLGACTNNTIRRNHLHDLGAGAIDVGRDYVIGTSGNIIDNNWVHHGSKTFLGAVGIRIGASSYNEVTHNDVSDYNYSGISVGWTVGYGTSSAHDNLIEKNHVHHIGQQRILSDMGLIYLVGEAPGTLVNNNYCHDVAVYDRGYGGWGIYLDEGSSNVTIRNNIVHSTSDGAFHLHYGRNNLIENNIFAWSEEAQVFRTRLEPEAYQSFDFLRNIIYFNNDILMTGGWEDLKYLFDYNCYWDTTSGEFVFPAGTFAQWQAAGQDVHSRIANPLFNDAEHYDFTLNPASPAVTQLGFVPISIGDAGLYGTAEWMAGPGTIAHPPTPLPTAPEGFTYSYDFEAWAPGSLPDGWEVYTDLDPDPTRVAVTEDTAARGSRSLRMRDATGLPYLWMPVAFLRPNYRMGLGVFRTWIRLSEDALFVLEGRDEESPGVYTVGPNLILADWGLSISGVVHDPPPRNTWFYLEITAPLGDDADGAFDLTVWTPGDGWTTYADQPCEDPLFHRMTWIGAVSYTDTADTIWVDDVETFTVGPGADADNDGILDWADGAVDFDNDGLPNYQDNDSDGDGISDADEYSGVRSSDDFDGDGRLNFLDTDSDGDSVADVTEGGGDPDGDGKPSFLDNDSDGNGILDSA